jgi:type I restriction enzyme M protein
MANPPFNVDLVDAGRITTDPRLPFGLPGVNKDKRVSAHWMDHVGLKLTPPT